MKLKKILLPVFFGLAILGASIISVVSGIGVKADNIKPESAVEDTLTPGAGISTDQVIIININGGSWNGWAPPSSSGVAEGITYEVSGETMVIRAATVSQYSSGSWYLSSPTIGDILPPNGESFLFWRNSFTGSLDGGSTALLSGPSLWEYEAIWCDAAVVFDQDVGTVSGGTTIGLLSGRTVVAGWPGCTITLPSASQMGYDYYSWWHGSVGGLLTGGGQPLTMGNEILYLYGEGVNEGDGTLRLDINRQHAIGLDGASNVLHKPIAQYTASGEVPSGSSVETNDVNISYGSTIWDLDSYWLVSFIGSGPIVIDLPTQANLVAGVNGEDNGEYTLLGWVPSGSSNATPVTQWTYGSSASQITLVPVWDNTPELKLLVDEDWSGYFYESYGFPYKPEGVITSPYIINPALMFYNVHAIGSQATTIYLPSDTQITSSISVNISGWVPINDKNAEPVTSWTIIPGQAMVTLVPVLEYWSSWHFDCGVNTVAMFTDDYITYLQGVRGINSLTPDGFTIEQGWNSATFKLPTVEQCITNPDPSIGELYQDLILAGFRIGTYDYVYDETSWTNVQVKRDYAPGATICLGDVAYWEDEYGSSVGYRYILILWETKKQNNAIEIDMRDLDYTGSAQTLLNATAAAGTIYYSLNTELNSSNYNSGTTTAPTATNPGIYTIYYYIPQTGNYNELAGAVRVEIRGLENAIKSETKDLYYTGSAQALLTASVTNGTIYYSLNTELNSSNYNTGSTTVPTATNVNVYTIYYYVPSSNGYSALQGQIDVEIMGNTMATATLRIGDGAGESVVGAQLEVGTQLKATISNNTDNASIVYKWYHNTSASSVGGTLISGATSSNYHVANTDIGKYIYVIATLTKTGYYDQVLTSQPTGQVLLPVNYSWSNGTTITYGNSSVLTVNVPISGWAGNISVNADNVKNYVSYSASSNAYTFTCTKYASGAHE
ncbi:MAG: hypothetical protein J6Q15_03055, partial [Clostridia bacterium]|nr:hypothetical protein [Clostridia bacterium]